MGLDKGSTQRVPFFDFRKLSMKQVGHISMTHWAGLVAAPRAMAITGSWNGHSSAGIAHFV